MSLKRIRMSVWESPFTLHSTDSWTIRILSSLFSFKRIPQMETFVPQMDTMSVWQSPFTLRSTTPLTPIYFPICGIRLWDSVLKKRTIFAQRECYEIWLKICFLLTRYLPIKNANSKFQIFLIRNWKFGNI